MLIVQVYVHVKPDQVEAFKAASVENARQSVQEAGIARFDVLQQQSEPTLFVLVEAYRTPADLDRHKQTAHYQTWREVVGPMMAEARNGVLFDNVYPEEAGWG
jgi:(4S)-4-hydroxy-5-phosphonooxypentane-2,3-dione isomerase